MMMLKINEQFLKIFLPKLEKIAGRAIKFAERAMAKFSIIACAHIKTSVLTAHKLHARLR